MPQPLVAERAQFVADFNHTGPGTPAGLFMRRFWQPVCRSVELSAGKAKPVRIMSENFTLFRGASGAPHIVGFRCAHRGTQLSTGWVEGDSIRCLYHGWRYDGSGQCVEAPAEQKGYAERTRIGAIPTREHLGLIFGYFGEGTPPPFPHLPPFEGEGIIETWVEKFPCNFFQCWENSWDEYHVHFTHRTGGIHDQMPQLPQWTFEETGWGIIRRTDHVGRHGRTSVFIMPNVLRISVPTPNALQGFGPTLRPSYLIKVPIDDDSHLFYAIQHLAMQPSEVAPYQVAYERYLRQRAEAPSTDVAATEILAGNKSLADYKDHPYLAIIEDQVAQCGQGLAANRDEEQLGRSDTAIAYMRRIWAREMACLAEGRPPKRWETLTKVPN